MFISIHSLDRRGDFLSTEASGRSPNAPAAKIASPEFELELITTREQFDALEADWNKLFARSGRSTQLFQTFNWNWHWANVYLSKPSDGSFAVVTARRNGRLVMVWPLVVERSFGLRVLSWMGAPVSQYGDVLAEQGPRLMPMLRETWNYLIAAIQPDAVKLNKTRADSIVAPLLAELGGIITQREEAPYLDLASAPTYAAYEERLSIKDRKNRRRHHRRLQEAGSVEVLTLAEGPDAADLAGKAVAMKRKWLGARGLVSPAVSDDRFAVFFRAAAGSVERPCGVRVSALTCAGTPTAMEIGLACRDRIAVHVLAYDTAFEKSGPGGVLMEVLLAARLNEGVAIVDMMAPGGGYKRDWADASVGVLDHAIGISAAGVVYARAYLGFARPRLKAAVEGLPAHRRRQIARIFNRSAD